MKSNDKMVSQGLKASVVFFIASLVSTGIAYITTPIFTRLLTTEEYGQVSVYLTWVQVFGIIAMFCLSYGVFNNGMVDYPDKRDDYSYSLLILSNIITVAFSIILLCLYPVIKPILGISLPLIILMLIVFIFQPAYNFWVARQRFELKYKWTLLWAILCAFLSPAVAILCIVLNKTGSNLYPRIFGAEITLIVIYAGFYVYLGIKNKWKINTSYWKAAILFNLPLIPHYLSTYLLNSSDRIMISYLVSDTATAFYTIAYSVGAVAIIVWRAINGSLIPYTYEHCKVKDYKSINKVTLPILTLFAVACMGVIMLAPEAVRVMATKEYMEAIYVIPPIVGGVFFQVQYYIYANVVYYYKKPKYVMIGSVTAVVLNLVLNYIFIKEFGYVAAGYTTIFCYAVQALIDYWGMKKVVPEGVYNMKYIFLLSAGLVIISLLSVSLYGQAAWIRYAILAVMVVAAIIMRKRIFEIWEKIKEK